MWRCRVKVIMLRLNWPSWHLWILWLTTGYWTDIIKVNWNMTYWVISFLKLKKFQILKVSRIFDVEMFDLKTLVNKNIEVWAYSTSTISHIFIHNSSYLHSIHCLIHINYHAIPTIFCIYFYLYNGSFVNLYILLAPPCFDH